MSDPVPSLSPTARYGWIRPRWFLAGLGLGLAGLSVFGWRIGRTDYHPGFVRFHSMLSPEGAYYPTLNEMKAIVRGKCSPGQILVIVGGNSILLGVWQPEAEVWSRRLQELLGDRYCVVNLAFRGAAPTDAAAVVAESLRKEFPRQVLIVNEAPITAVGAFGHDPYRYVFWQGYYTGQLLEAPARDRRIREEIAGDKVLRGDLREVRFSIYADVLLHYRDLWNWVTYRYFGTTASYRETHFPDYLRPRRIYPDPEIDATDPKNLELEYRPESLDAEMRIIRGIAPYYTRLPGGKWQLAAVTRVDLAQHFDEAFPQSLKARTLVLLSGTSPFYRDRLSADEAAMVNQSYQDTREIWQHAGYPTLVYGLDFQTADFGDRVHLSKFGGWKLAAQVAPEVQAIAGRLGYLK